jgi:tetratricopeptide (TPR) repeat protein
MKVLNIQLLIILLVCALLLGAAIYFLHDWQVYRHADIHLSEAEQAERRAEAAERHGDLEAAKGERGNAVGHLSWYIQMVPKDVDVREKLAFLLSKQGQYKRAFKVFEDVLRLDPTRREARRELVDVAMAIQRFSDAAVHLEALLRTSPNEPKLLELFGRCQEETLEPIKAITSYRRAIELDPKQISTYQLLADLLRRELEHNQEADALMQALVESNPDSLEARLSYGNYLRKSNQPDKAMREALRCLEMQPDDSQGLWLAARCSLAKDDLETARRYAQRGIELYPADISLYTTLADVELRAERREAAIEALQRGLKATADHPQLLWSMANLLVDVGRLKEAAGITDRLEALDNPPYPTVLIGYLRARLAFVEGHWLQAIQGFDQVRGGLTRWPDLMKQADFWTGKSYGKLGNTDQQIAALRRAVSADPLFAPARAALAEALLKAGRTNEAMVEYAFLRRKITRDSAIPWARMQIVRTLQMPAARRDWEEATDTLREAERLIPDSVDVPILRAEILLAQGRVADAESVLARARDQKPEEVEFWEKLSLVAERGGDFARAEEILGEAQRRLGDKVELRVAHGRYLVRREAEKSAPALWKLAKDYRNLSENQRVQLWQGLVGCALQINDAELAKWLCRRIFEVDSHDVKSQVLLFELALREKDEAGMDRALGELERIEKGPLWLYARAVRLTLQARGPKDVRLDQALELLGRARELRPSWGRLSLLAAGIYDQQGKTDEALEQYRQAIKEGEEGPAAVRRAVELLSQEQRFTEANELLERFATLPPELLGSARETKLRTGDVAGALDSARKAAAGSSDSRDYLWLGQILSLTAQRAASDRQTTDSLRMNEEAEKALRHATELNGKAADPWVVLIHFFATTGQRSKAQAAIEQAKTQLGPERRNSALARCHEALGEPAAAKQLYQQELAAAPDDARLVREAADFYFRANYPQEAETQLRRIIDGKTKARPADVCWARRRLAELLDARDTYLARQEGLRLLRENLAAERPGIEDEQLLAHLTAKSPGAENRDKAIETFESLIQGRRTPRPEDLFVLAQLYLAKGDRSNARNVMYKLLAAYGDNPAYLAEYIRGLLRFKEYENAGTWIQQLESLAPHSFVPAGLQAEIQVGRGQHDAALATLQRYLNDARAQPADRGLRAHLVGARLAELGGRLRGDDLAATRRRYLDEAEKLYRQFVSLHPDKEIHLAALLARNGKLDESLDIIERRQDATPPLPLAQTCVSVLNHPDATPDQRRRTEKVLDDALGKHGRTAPLLLVAADAYTRLERYDAAEQAYREIIKEDPDHAVAMNNLAVLLALRKKDAAEAMQLIDAALAKAGPVGSMLDSRATVYMARGESEKALADIEAAIADNKTPVRLFHLAEIHELTGRPKSALAVFADAEEAGLTPDLLQPLERPGFFKLKKQQEEASRERETAQEVR